MARFLVVANAVGRIAVRGARNSRILRAGAAAAGSTLRSVGRVLHLMFLQMMGLLFCVFALGLAARIPRAYHDRVGGAQSPGRMYLLVFLSVMFAWFGVTSFWRSRSK